HRLLPTPFSPTVAAPSTLLPHVEQYEVVWPQRLSASRARRALPSHLDLYPESVSFGHCFYQGHVEGHHHSAASLSTCAGLRGFFRAGSDVHLIEPLDGGGEEGQHALYRAQHLQQKAGTCGVSNTSLEKALGPRISAAFRPRNWPVARDTRYVELYVVTDSAEFRRLGSRAAVRSRVMEVVNHVDKLYQELNFRVVLVGLEMWNQEDQIHVSSNPDTTLDNFLRWRTQNLVGRHQHDNAQLITGVEFTGTTVGLAKVSAMCSQDSGAVNQDHNLKNPIGVASTMAHEMGHNLGMDHDENIQGCHCPVPREGGGCIMALPRVRPPHRTHSEPRHHPEGLLGRGRRSALEPTPTSALQACRDPCCNATTCQLAAGAQCAQGSCCHDCRVTPAGELCRPPKDACDLEEYCDGQQPACPEDVFQENGTPCPGGYCYNGVCPTLAQKCRDLWGLGSQVAVETCYTYNILPGCQGRVNKCGILYCEGGQKPPERSSCSLTSPAGTCQALVLEGGAGYEPVPEGAKCGEEKICWKGLCQLLQVYRSRNCSAQCNSRGVCNHKGECHCHPGWAPPHCAEPLPHMRTGRPGLPGAFTPVWPDGVQCGSRHTDQSCFLRRSAAPKTAKGLSNPLFHEGHGMPAKGGAPSPTTHPSQPTTPTTCTATPKQPPPAVSTASCHPRAIPDPF
uniref:ADAM metallopeptidase domain 8 n=1 Tax=Ursus maritimus TaxID=29073 RepID=A0A452TZI3_URSMA